MFFFESEHLGKSGVETFFQRRRQSDCITDVQQLRRKLNEGTMRMWKG